MFSMIDIYIFPFCFDLLIWNNVIDEIFKCGFIDLCEVELLLSI